MANSKVFFPDQADYRRSFEEEQRNMELAVAAAVQGNGLNFSPYEQFYDSWRHYPEDDATRTLAVNGGAREFARSFDGALRRAEAWIREVVKLCLSDFETVLDPIDEIASGGTPDLVRWASGDLGMLGQKDSVATELGLVCPIADSWGDDHDMAPGEALRALTLASRITRIEAIDPWKNVTADMTIINELCDDRLWSGRKVNLTVNYAVYKEGTKQGQVHPGVAITFGSSRDRLTVDAEPKSRMFKCRMVVDGATTWLVLTKSRPKDLEATILKELEADPNSVTGARRVALDRRGIMHVLVAVGVGEQWRACHDDDTVTFAELVRQRLWQKPLVPVEHKSWTNPESSPDFRRVKMLGRLYRPSTRSGHVKVAASVEHQVITVATLLSSAGAKSSLNHDIYRQQRILRVLVPILFSPNFERLGMRLGN